MIAIILPHTVTGLQLQALAENNQYTVPAACRTSPAARRRMETHRGVWLQVLYGGTGYRNSGFGSQNPVPTAYSGCWRSHIRRRRWWDGAQRGADCTRKKAPERHRGLSNQRRGKICALAMESTGPVMKQAISEMHKNSEVECFPSKTRNKPEPFCYYN